MRLCFNILPFLGILLFCVQVSAVQVGVATEVPDPTFGNVPVGTTTVINTIHTAPNAIGLGVCATCPAGKTCTGYVRVKTTQLSGATDFAIVQDGCTNARLSGNQCCTDAVSFKPSILGLITGTVEYTSASIAQDGSFVGNSTIDVPLSGTGTPALGPIDTNHSQCGNNASTINFDSRSLGETIPLVGVPFTLSYSSDRLRSGSTYPPVALGLGGWTPSLVHHYDTANNILFGGDGSLRNLQAVPIGSGYYATDAQGSEVYYFDGLGVHQKTNDAQTGNLKYSFSYDSNGRISQIQDQFNNLTTISYQSAGATVTGPYGQINHLAFDANGFLASVTNPNQETYQLVNGAGGLLASFQKPGGQTSVFAYDQYGYLIQDQGAGGNVLNLNQTFDLSSLTQTLMVSTALSRTSTYVTRATPTSSNHSTVDPTGGVSVQNFTSAAGDTAKDSFGNLYQDSQLPDPRFGLMAAYPATTTYAVPNSSIALSQQITKTATLSDPSDPLSLTAASQQTTLQNDPTRIFTSTYTATTRTLQQSSPLGRTTQQVYNANGQLSSVVVGSLNPIVFNYDSRGRFTSSTQATRQASATYDANGNLATQTDALGRVTSFTYDPSNRVISEILPDLNVIAMTYDANGNMTSLTPPGRLAHTFTYDLFELVQNYIPPSLGAQLSGATTYSYNLDRQLAQVNQPDGTNIAYTYDSASGLLRTITTPSGAYAYTYAPNTNLIQTLTSPDQETLSFTYAGNLPLTVTAQGPVNSQVQTTYNTDGSVGALVVTGAVKTPQTLTYGYDKDGLLVKSGDESLVRNNFGAVSSTTLNKVVENEAYDLFGALISDQYLVGKSEVYNQSLTRDSLGRIVASELQSRSCELSDKSLNYSYDSEGRLVKAQSESASREYSYDTNGNRITFKENGNTIIGTYNAQDQLVSYGSTEYTYDLNGNLKQKIETDPKASWWRFFAKDEKRTTSYVYDSFGNLKKVTLPDGDIIEYIVDGQNRRVGKKRNGVLRKQFVYQSQTQIVAELDGQGRILKSFVYGSKSNTPDYMVMDGREYRIISDQVGTPKLVIDSKTGEVLEQPRYDEFGRALDVDGSVLPIGFAGGLHDHTTRLVRFGARDYDPVGGRWVSKDPILFGGGDTNLFGYVLSDPVNKIDPKGIRLWNGSWSDKWLGYSTDVWQSYTVRYFARALRQRRKHNPTKTTGTTSSAAAYTV